VLSFQPADEVHICALFTLFAENHQYGHEVLTADPVERKSITAAGHHSRAWQQGMAAA
jgi:hypothetical protein